MVDGGKTASGNNQEKFHLDNHVNLSLGFSTAHSAHSGSNADTEAERNASSETRVRGRVE